MARDARICVVHGGGPQISALARERGVEPHFVGGRRVTDEPMLACVREGLAAVSAELCAALAEAGPQADRASPTARSTCAASPSSASSASPRARAWTRSATRSPAAACPVVAPLGRDAGGTVLNVNADDAAAAIATALGADELVFLSDVPGVLDEQGVVLSHISASQPPASATGGHAAEARGLRRRRCSAASRASASASPERW